MLTCSLHVWSVKLKGQWHLHRNTEENTVKEEFCFCSLYQFLMEKANYHHFQLKSKPVHALVLLDLNLHTNAKRVLLKTKDRTTV